MNNHNIQIAELALEFFQVFWIFLEFFSVQKCHAKGQKFKLLNIKDE
jgi:hypothetical protein